MDYREIYSSWCKSDFINPQLRSELLSLQDEREIEDRFYKSLEFGTAGLRGIIGAGTNRMNIHTVRQATQGLAEYIKTIDGASQMGVAIAYDSRLKSDEFAKAAALVLCQNGIKVYLFNRLHPVPMLSFTVRYLRCIAGIVITASHNPPEYNGYKVYWQDGGQTTPDKCKAISDCIERLDPLTVQYMSESEARDMNLLEYIGDEVDNEYYEYTSKLAIHKELTKEQREGVKIVYSPLHGSGLIPVTTLLNRLCYNNLTIVEAQKQPNGHFPTVEVPNPETADAFSMALELAAKENADVAIATDPDSDRLGVCIRRGDGSYDRLTGNRIGSLLVYYILSSLKEKGELPEDAYVVQSLVSTECTQAICDYFGVELRKVLTGFRYIAEQIEQNKGSFIFGFEESHGFLTGTRVRDKDACLAAMLVCEACAYYKTVGKSLEQVFHEMEKLFGSFTEECVSFKASGKDGMEKIADYMAELHGEKTADLAGASVLVCYDYKKGIRYDYRDNTQTEILLPKSDVLCYELEGALRICIRPSGTEPKLKLYFSAVADTKEESQRLLNDLKQKMVAQVDSRMNS